MARLKTNGKKKMRKALRRVEEVVLREVRNNIEQQRQRKAKVVAWKSNR